MRFGNKNPFKTLRMYLLRKKEYKSILQKLRLNSEDIKEILNKGNTSKLSRHQLINKCSIYQKYNVNVKPLRDFHHCLILKNLNIEHRINILKDMGVSELNSTLIYKMHFYFQKCIPIVKETVNIPAEVNIVKNIFDKLGVEVPSNILQLSDKSTMCEYYKACLFHCKTQIFKLPYLDDKILLHTSAKYKSLSMIAETLKILRVDLDYNAEMIRKNPIVIAASANNIRSLLDSFTEILEIPIVTFLRRYPHVLVQSVDNTKQLLLLFKQYEIPNEHVTNSMHIFDINSDVFMQRMETLKRHPELHIWCKHKRILQMILHYDNVMDRIKYLNISNHSKWMQPHTILSAKDKMENFLQLSGSVTLSKSSLKYIIKKELGVDKNDLLIRHQHWKTVTLFDIEQTLNYLKMHFTINEICHNIHIIFYAQSKIEKILADLKQQYSQNTEYSFTNSQYLALCLYILEKDTNFTGDGIWDSKCKTKQQSSYLSEKGNSVKDIDVNTSVTKNIDDDSDTKDSKDKIRNVYL